MLPNTTTTANGVGGGNAMHPNRSVASPMSHNPSTSVGSQEHAHLNHDLGQQEQKPLPPTGRVQRGMAFIHHWPTWREWVGDLWLDLLTFIVVGAASLAMNTVDAVGGSRRKFIIWDEDGNFINPEIGKTRGANIIPIWLSTFLSIIVPVLFIVLSQLRVRSAYDVHVAVWGAAWAILLSSFLQVFNKLLIGGIRPHFLDVCQPRDDILPGSGTGFHGLYFDKSICTGSNERHINDALKSWPSGHTAVAFAGFVWASLYFNGKFKVFSDERPHFWKIVVFCLPPIGACLIGGAMILDHSHHWYDVIGGGTIGILSAFATYRANYASVWDFRFNHIPLPRPSSPWKAYPYNHLPSHALGKTAGHGAAESSRRSMGRRDDDLDLEADRHINPASHHAQSTSHHYQSGGSHLPGSRRGRGYDDDDLSDHEERAFTYTSAPRDRFPDWVHGWGSGRRGWRAGGAPGDAAAVLGRGEGLRGAVREAVRGV